MYRSGHNENDSKSFCPAMGAWVRIPPSPPFFKNLLNKPLYINDFSSIIIIDIFIFS